MTQHIDGNPQQGKSLVATRNASLTTTTAVRGNSWKAITLNDVEDGSTRQRQPATRQVFGGNPQRTFALMADVGHTTPTFRYLVNEPENSPFTVANHAKSTTQWIMAVSHLLGITARVTGEGSLVTNYFGEGLHLPAVWILTVFHDKGRFKLLESHQTMEEEALRQVVNQLVAKASFFIRCECWNDGNTKNVCNAPWSLPDRSDTASVYLPNGAVDRIVAATVKLVLGDADQFAPGLLLSGETETVDGGQDKDDEDDDEENAEMPRQIGFDCRKIQARGGYQ